MRASSCRLVTAGYITNSEHIFVYGSAFAGPSCSFQDCQKSAFVLQHGALGEKGPASELPPACTTGSLSVWDTVGL